MQTKYWIAAAWLFAAALPATAQQALATQKTARHSYEMLNLVNSKVPGSQDQPMRRCRAYMDEAVSSEKLGAQDMAAKNWEKAARGCRQEALTACRAHKAAAPAAECELLQR